MQPLHHLQVESDLSASMRDVGSSKKTWIALGFGCFVLGIACACLVLPGASHAEPAHQDLAYAPMGFLPQSKSTRSASKAFDSPVFRPAFAQRAFTPAANAAASATSLKALPSLRSDGEWELLESAGGVDSMHGWLAGGRIIISEEIACPVEEELQACIKAFADQAATESLAANAPASTPKKKDQASIMAWHASKPQSAPKKVIVYDAEGQGQGGAQQDWLAQQMFARSQLQLESWPKSAPKKKDQASIMAWHASKPQSTPKKVIVYDAEGQGQGGAQQDWLAQQMFARSQLQLQSWPASPPKKKDQASIMAWHASKPQYTPKKVIVYNAETLNSPTSEPKPPAKKEAPAAQDVQWPDYYTPRQADSERSYKAAMAANPERPGSRAAMAASAKKPSGAPPPGAPPPHPFDDAFDAIATDHINKLDKA